MSYTLEVLPDAPIIWEVWGEDFDAAVDNAAITRDIMRILNASRQQMVIVADLRSVQLEWEDIVYLANKAVPPEINQHPRLQKIIVITSDEIVQKAIEGMSHEAFGAVKFDIVSSPERAMAQARRYLH